MNILFLPGSYSSPAARFRVWQFVKPLCLGGHRVDVKVISPVREWTPSIRSKFNYHIYSRVGSVKRLISALWITKSIEKYDVVFMNRDLIPEVSITWLEPWLIKQNPRIIFDFDDAIYLGTRQAKLQKILPLFAWLTPGNSYLAEFAKQHNEHISIWPTVIDTDRYSPAKERKSHTIRIGWSGTKDNLRYLSILEQPIRNLATNGNVEFVVISDIEPDLKWNNVDIRYIRWNEKTEVKDLQEIDIGVMPLRDGPFERGKCGFKAISYMGIGVPALVSPVGANNEIVIHGETGFHCYSGEDWSHYLRLLVQDASLRCRMGVKARARVKDVYSVKVLLPQMLEVFKIVAEQ